MSDTFKSSNGWYIDGDGRCSESYCDRPAHEGLVRLAPEGGDDE